MKSKKVIAMLLTYAVLLTSLITPAYAENEDETAASASTTNQTKDIDASAEAVQTFAATTTQETSEITTTENHVIKSSVISATTETTTTEANTTEASKAKATTTSKTSKAKVSKAKSTTTSKAKKTSKKESYTKKELRYMAAIIFCEAGNQSYAGKLAVGIVVKNRMESKKFPSSIKGVLYQPYQFTPTRNGHMSAALRKYDKTGFKKGSAYKSCLKAAKEALSGQKKVVVGGKTRNMKGYYFFSRYVSGCRLRIGAHMFK